MYMFLLRTHFHIGLIQTHVHIFFFALYSFLVPSLSVATILIKVKSYKFVFAFDFSTNIPFNVCIYLFSLLTWDRYDTRLIFKWIKAGLNEFSFFYTSCFTKSKESSMLYYLPKAGGKTNRFLTFARALA